MDFKPETDGHATDFYLSYLEEEVRSKLGDTTARITQTTEGRVSVHIQEDLLEDFLNQLHAPKGIDKNWSQESKDMLKEAQAKCSLVSEENADLKLKMGKICTMLRQTQRESREKLDQMKEENEALQNKINKLDKVRQENVTLRGELEAMKLELRVEKQLRHTAEHNVEVAAHPLNVQLKEAQAKCNLVSEENADLKSKMGRICTMLRQTQRESREKLDQVKEENEALQNKINKLDKVWQENVTLRGELEAMKLELRKKKKLRY
ncbi:hypothetical protein D9C73_028148 [Collichthys lucidus]|uniref:Uncharacterized protein n=1 Tax=Collichthys lucidus TaxID=240159 RepID=A0A4U5TVN7_COLLU|nr:hypothetical protein D9C73_028148 [Collichthys lucidus]